MLALSVQQPWAWAIAMGLKPVENRTWETKFRGKFLVHAGKKIDKDGIDFLKNQMCLPLPEEFQTGGIVGVSNIVHCTTKHSSRYFFGPYGFVLSDSHPVNFIPLKGRLKFFESGISYSEIRLLNHVKIRCPNCGSIENAVEEQAVPFWVYIHHCKNCHYIIMESEWEIVENHKENEAKDFGYSNSWTKIPDYVELCQSMGHILESKSVGRNVIQYFCPKCSYKYMTDSSD